MTTRSVTVDLDAKRTVRSIQWKRIVVTVPATVTAVAATVVLSTADPTVTTASVSSSAFLDWFADNYQ